MISCHNFVVGSLTLLIIMRDLVFALSNASPYLKGTTLITFLSQADASPVLATKQMEKEVGTCDSIKDKSVGKAVKAALGKAIKALKTFSGSVKNGFVLLAGDVGQRL